MSTPGQSVEALSPSVYSPDQGVCARSSRALSNALRHTSVLASAVHSRARDSFLHSLILPSTPSLLSRLTFHLAPPSLSHRPQSSLFNRAQPSTYGRPISAAKSNTNVRTLASSDKSSSDSMQAAWRLPPETPQAQVMDVGGNIPITLVVDPMPTDQSTTAEPQTNSPAEDMHRMPPVTTQQTTDVEAQAEPAKDQSREARRRRHHHRRRPTRRPTLRIAAIRRKIFHCIVAVTLLSLILMTYSILSTQTSSVSQGFSIVTILVVVALTIFLIHAIVRLVLLILRYRRRQAAYQRKEASNNTKTAFPTISKPLPLSTDCDLELGLSDGVDAVKMPVAPPPAYGYWRGKVYTKSDLHKEQNRSLHLDDDEPSDRPVDASPLPCPSAIVSPLGYHAAPTLPPVCSAANIHQDKRNMRGQRDLQDSHSAPDNDKTHISPDASPLLGGPVGITSAVDDVASPCARQAQAMHQAVRAELREATSPGAADPDARNKRGTPYRYF